VASNVGVVVGKPLAASVATAVVGADVVVEDVVKVVLGVVVDLGAQAAKKAAPIPPNNTITSLRLNTRPTGASSLSRSIFKISFFLVTDVTQVNTKPKAKHPERRGHAVRWKVADDLAPQSKERTWVSEVSATHPSALLRLHAHIVSRVP